MQPSKQHIMEINIYTWLIGALVVIVLVAIIARRFSANLSKKGFSIFADKNKTEKSNKLIVKGSKHDIQQDVNKEEKENSKKHNVLEVEGLEHKIKQDVNELNKLFGNDKKKDKDEK